MKTALLVVAVFSLACHAQPQQVSRRYALHGTILAVNRSSGNIVVHHDDIPGYMSAMTMPYAAGNPQDLTFLESGDEIRAEVVVTIEGAAHLEHITVLAHAKVKSVPRRVSRRVRRPGLGNGCVPSCFAPGMWWSARIETSTSSAGWGPW